eukprot:12929711-Prorocentrum_lima.AAC.1
MNCSFTARVIVVGSPVEPCSTGAPVVGNAIATTRLQVLHWPAKDSGLAVSLTCSMRLLLHCAWLKQKCTIGSAGPPVRAMGGANAR